MITLTIKDNVDSMTFTTLLVPITLSPIINETDVETLDGNISTYYSTTKRNYTFKLGYLDKEAYAQLRTFVTRQYQNLKYPRITIAGDENINAENMTAKMTINDQDVINNCGLVEGVTVTFRESKQMP